MVSLLTGGEEAAAQDMKTSLFQAPLHESGVDMAFDALMDLEKNSDLSDFMKNYIESSDTMESLWTVNNNKLRTNSETESVLR